MAANENNVTHGAAMSAAYGMARRHGMAIWQQHVKHRNIMAAASAALK